LHQQCSWGTVRAKLPLGKREPVPPPVCSPCGMSWGTRRPGLWAESYYNDVAQCCDSPVAGGDDEREDSVSPLMQVCPRAPRARSSPCRRPAMPAYAGGARGQAERVQAAPPLCPACLPACSLSLHVGVLTRAWCSPVRERAGTGCRTRAHRAATAVAAAGRPGDQICACVGAERVGYPDVHTSAPHACASFPLPSNPNPGPLAPARTAEGGPHVGPKAATGQG